MLLHLSCDIHLSQVKKTCQIEPLKFSVKISYCCVLHRVDINLPYRSVRQSGPGQITNVSTSRRHFRPHCHIQ